MVTASHNPPQDNGYKVYLADGAQLVPPADAEIEAAIRAVWPLSEVPLGDEGSVVPESLVESYVAAVAGLVAGASGTESRALGVSSTPPHGVGAPALQAPTWRWPTTPTPTGAPWRCPPERVGACCAATRWACCWPTT